MMHTYYIERSGEDIPVFVEYEWTPPRRATQYDPAEGGVEIVSVKCDTRLAVREMENAEQSAIDAAWEDHYERGIP
jgi:hypothetical protein